MEFGVRSGTHAVRHRCGQPLDQVTLAGEQFGDLSHIIRDHAPDDPVDGRASSQRDVLTFVDLAHSAGLYPISLRELGCDFAGILNYKWMYGPYAAGLLYISRDRLNDLQVTYAGGRAERELDWSADTYSLHDSAERFQFGPWSWPLVHTWAYAADWLTEIGLDAIWSRTVALTDMLKDGLREIPGTTLHTPRSAGQSAALVSFALENWTGEELTRELRDRWNVIIKPIPNAAEGVRVSVPFFGLESEIELLLEAVDILARERP
jgi:cysteine desulfurase / selenocysteine lyase